MGLFSKIGGALKKAAGAVGKAASYVVKPALAVASFIPGVGAIAAGASAALGALTGSSKGTGAVPEAVYYEEYAGTTAVIAAPGGGAGSLSSLNRPSVVLPLAAVAGFVLLSRGRR